MSSQYVDSSVMYRLVLPFYHVMYSTRYVVSLSRRGAARTSCPRLPHCWIWASCSATQSLSHLPWRDILWRSINVSTTFGIGCFIPNWWRTHSGWCPSTIQKYINGTSALQICWQAVQYASREPCACMYGSHTICINGSLVKWLCEDGWLSFVMELKEYLSAIWLLVHYGLGFEISKHKQVYDNIELFPLKCTLEKCYRATS